MSENLKQRAKEILDIQTESVNDLNITEEMLRAIEVIIERSENKKGRVITAGMGKAGIIGHKMSATMASIGIPSFFVSPAESAHGDIGRIGPDDTLIVFSNSGSTSEVMNMIQTVNRLNDNNNFIISIGSSKNPKIPVDLAIGYGKLEESCVVSKVPSTSTTVMLIIADIIAITAAESMGFDDSWFKKRHPGGAIGKSYEGKDH